MLLSSFRARRLTVRIQWSRRSRMRLGMPSGSGSSMTSTPGMWAYMSGSWTLMLVSTAAANAAG